MDNLESAWFRQARRPYNQKAADWGYLPGVVHRGLHVVLPNVRWSNVLYLSWAPLPLASIYVEISTVFPSSFPCAWLHLRDLPSELIRLLGLALHPSRSDLSMPSGFLCHAGGWHLRRKPRVELFFVPSCSVVLFRFFVTFCVTLSDVSAALFLIRSHIAFFFCAPKIWLFISDASWLSLKSVLECIRDTPVNART